MKNFDVAAPLGRRVAGLALAAGLASGPVLAQTPLAGAGLPAFWQWQNPRPVGVNLTDVVAPNDSVAYVAGNEGVLLKTTNRGRSWRALPLGTPTDLRRVSFANAQVGWALAAMPYGSRGAQVRRTTDGGLTWTTQTVGGITVNVTGMLDVVARSPTDALVLVAINGAPILYRTTDGGLTWTNVPTNMLGTLTKARLQFTSLTVGYATVETFSFGGISSKLMKTVDGGANWVDITPSSETVAATSFVSGQIGWTAGGDAGSAVPNCYTTANGGSTWQPRDIGGPGSFVGRPTYGLQQVAFADALRGIAISSSDVYMTSNGGLTWSRSPDLFDTPLQFNRLCLRPSGVGWLVGNGGRMANTADFGLTWTYRSQSLDDFKNYNTISQLQAFEPGYAWALIGDNAVFGAGLVRTRCRGEPWHRQSTGLLPTNVRQVRYRALYFADRDTGLVQVNTYDGLTNTTADLLLHTADAGQTWTNTPVALLPRTEAVALAFRDARRGLLFTDRRQTLRTTDGGRTWQPRATGAVHPIFAATWASAQTVYALGDSATALKSTDGGLNWQPLPALSALLPMSRLDRSTCGLAFATPQTGIVVSGAGLYGYQRTTDGGATWTTLNLPNIDGQVVIPTNVSFTNATDGWMLAYASSGNFVFTTRNAGLTWAVAAKVSNGNNVEFPAAVGAFVDRYNGYTGGANAALLRYSEKFLQADTLASQRRSYCAGDVLALAYTATGSLSANPADYRIQLSDLRGRFRPGQTTTLVPAPGSALGQLRATLPPGLAPGSRYRVRAVLADGTLLGADNGRDLLITAPVPPATLTRLPGGPLQAALPAGTAAPARYEWERNGQPVPGQAGAQFPNPTAGSYRVRACSAGCCGPWSAATVLATAAQVLAAQVQVWPNPAPASGPGLTVTAPVGATLTLLNALGQAVGPALAVGTSGRLRLPTAGLAAGLYVLRVQAGAAGTVSRRLVLE